MKVHVQIKYILLDLFVLSVDVVDLTKIYWNFITILIQTLSLFTSKTENVINTITLIQWSNWRTMKPI